MSDIAPENFAEYATQDGEGSPSVNADDHPEQEAHGGSMAPGQVDDTGRQVAETPPTAADQEIAG